MPQCFTKNKAFQQHTHTYTHFFPNTFTLGKIILSLVHSKNFSQKRKKTLPLLKSFLQFAWRCTHCFWLCFQDNKLLSVVNWISLCDERVENCWIYFMPCTATYFQKLQILLNFECCRITSCLHCYLFLIEGILLIFEWTLSLVVWALSPAVVC